MKKYRVYRVHGKRLALKPMTPVLYGVRWEGGPGPGMLLGAFPEAERLSAGLPWKEVKLPMKCQHPGGVIVKPDGVNELDPCIYEEIERYRNVMVSVMRCKVCGHVEVSWTRQEDTEEVELDE